MELHILDQEFQTIDVIDSFSSLIWADRYNEIGDFELVTSDISWKKKIKKNYYARIKESDRLMIIDGFSGSGGSEDAPELTISGHSLEQLLNRRIVWDRFSFEGPIYNAVYRLMNENVMNPSIPGRKIPNFGFGYDGSLHDGQYLVSFDDLIGDYLFDTIKSACDLYDIGFRVCYYGGSTFNLELYKGVDRSYKNPKESTVLFSPRLDNLQNTSFEDTDVDCKNVVYVVADNVVDEAMADGSEPAYITTVSGNVSGIERREAYLEETIDDAYQYDKENYLRIKGQSALKEYEYKLVCDGEILPNSSAYSYDKDYFLGDIVQIEDDFGNQSRSRVTEVIFSEDESGYTSYPTFTSLS